MWCKKSVFHFLINFIVLFQLQWLVSCVNTLSGWTRKPWETLKTSQHGEQQSLFLSHMRTNTYRVCHGFRLMQRDHYFRVDFEHFVKSLILYHFDYNLFLHETLLIQGLLHRNQLRITRRRSLRYPGPRARRRMMTLPRWRKKHRWLIDKSFCFLP